VLNLVVSISWELDAFAAQAFASLPMVCAEGCFALLCVDSLQYKLSCFY